MCDGNVDFSTKSSGVHVQYSMYTWLNFDNVTKDKDKIIIIILIIINGIICT